MNTVLLIAALSIIGSDVSDRPTVIAVIGTPGTDDYAEQFEEWSTNWQASADVAGTEFISIGLDKANDVTDHDRLQRELMELQQASGEPLWLVLIGHGTFDGRVAKFNLRGPDVTADELAKWVDGLKRPIVIVNCASSSGPFVNRLAGRNRVVVTATKSGVEQNFARFGQYMSEAIGDTKFDLDKDEQTSLLEAFIAASSRVEVFYKEEGRLATEHALIDDNGDGKGTPAAWFRGVRATKSAKDGAIDGVLANRMCLIHSEHEGQLSAEQRSQRDQLEAKIELLRMRKDTMPTDAYYKQLEELLVAAAKVYESATIEQTQPEAN